MKIPLGEPLLDEEMWQAALDPLDNERLAHAPKKRLPTFLGRLEIIFSICRGLGE